MTLAFEPSTLTCAVCGDGIDSGYLPVTGTDGGDEPLTDAAACGACGFTAVGMDGCAPELDDLTDDPAADALCHVRFTGDGVEVLRRK
jgi:hypothetical protein